MATSFRQWESDPLFSAAEVVQDSADRMESIFRILLHEQSLLQGYPAGIKLLNSIEYHRRDLETAIGTTKWQLQDFEKAVNLSSLSDRSHTKADAISKHKQFIAAIREQIIHVEKSLEDPATGGIERNTDWINLNEQDRDGLALFLSGGNSFDHHAQRDLDGSMIRRCHYLHKDSVLDDKSDEIVELKTENIGDSQATSVTQINHSFENMEENNLRRAGSHYSSCLDFESPGHGQDGNWDSEFSDPNAKSFVSKNKSKGQSRRLDILGFLGRFWSVYCSRVGRRFPKRKDEEMRGAFDQRPLSPYMGISLEQGRHISGGFCSDILRKTMQPLRWPHGTERGYQRLQYFIQFSRLPLPLLLMMILALVILGILFFQAA